MSEQLCDVGRGIELCYETFGNPANPSALLIMGLGAYLPFSPLGKYLGFVPLPWQFWPILAVTLLCYVALTQIIKMWMVKKNLI